MNESAILGTKLSVQVARCVTWRIARCYDPDALFKVKLPTTPSPAAPWLGHTFAHCTCLHNRTALREGLATHASLDCLLTCYVDKAFVVLWLCEGLNEVNMTSMSFCGCADSPCMRLTVCLLSMKGRSDCGF